MSLVAFVSGRSPGLTTTVHALTLAWPRLRRAIAAELDPDGGCLAVRQELAAEPGLTTLAAAGRRGLAADAVLAHCQQLRDGALALLAPVAPERAASALSVLGTRLAVALDTLAGVDVLADCGRIDAHSPAFDVARSARYVVLVVTPTLEGVAHCQARINNLGFAPGRAAVLTIGSRPYRPDEVGAALDLPVLGSIANDRRGADDLGSGRIGRRSDLLRSAATLAEGLASHLAPIVAEDVQPPAGWPPVAEARHETVGWLPVAGARHDAAGWLPVAGARHETAEPQGPQRAQLWSPPHGSDTASSAAALADRAPPWQ